MSFSVVLGHNHLEDSRAMRRQQLLLQPADRQHLAAQRDLAGHAMSRRTLNLGERARQSPSQA
jgi:hypothetical protein